VLRLPVTLSVSRSGSGHGRRKSAGQCCISSIATILPILRLPGITSELYGGGPDLRIRQEAMLGIGGWRLLRALGLRPEVCHLNEGHAAFAVLERARSYMLDNNQPFDVSLAITRAGNLFTTHTPVEAGFDRFAPG